MASGCIVCQKYLANNVYFYSIQTFGVPLCRLHQYYIRRSKATKEAIDLYFALLRKGVPAQIEKFDGFKTIDIAIPPSKLNIEVDGVQHYSNPKQALADLQRTYYSYEKGYTTLRIPNSLVQYHIEEVVKCITDFLTAKNNRDWQRNW